MKKTLLFLAFTTSLISQYSQTANLQWVNQLGASGSDYVYGLHADTAGNIYITGGFNGTMNADPGPGTINLTSLGGSDVFTI